MNTNVSENLQFRSFQTIREISIFLNISINSIDRCYFSFTRYIDMKLYTFNYICYIIKRNLNKFMHYISILFAVFFFVCLSVYCKHKENEKNGVFELHDNMYHTEFNK